MRWNIPSFELKGLLRKAAKEEGVARTQAPLERKSLLALDLQAEFVTYQEIAQELSNPIEARELEPQMIKKLYQSKIVYLEKIRMVCFEDLNRSEKPIFSTEDYQFIMQAKTKTIAHLRGYILQIISQSIENRINI